MGRGRNSGPGTTLLGGRTRIAPRVNWLAPTITPALQARLDEVAAAIANVAGREPAALWGRALIGLELEKQISTLIQKRLKEEFALGEMSDFRPLYTPQMELTVDQIIELEPRFGEEQLERWIELVNLDSRQDSKRAKAFVYELLDSEHPTD